MIYQPHPYQDHATEHIIDNPASGLFLEMGLGKTVATLTAVDRLMFEFFDTTKVLVIAPKRVAEHTWTTECTKWDHLGHLRISRVLGTEKQRKQALQEKADIYVINRENVVWLVSHLGGAWPFDMVVIDELSSFKSAKSARFKALRMVRPKIRRIVGLTGTPVPNGLLDLWPQLYLLDMGERLGKTLTGYRERYFTPGKRNGHIVYEYKLRKDDDADLLGDDFYQKLIYDKIGDICISMKAEDWLDLPPLIENNVELSLSPALQRQYDLFERDLVMTLGDEEISAVNAATMSNKLLQFANGAIYDEKGNYHEIHREKIDALDELVDLANGKPVLVCYSYRHDVERIQRYLKHYKPVVLRGPGDVDDWNRRKIRLMLGHPASMGHGLNMQAGGNIVAWFGRPWNLEHFQQAPARLNRQGQEESVVMNSLLMRNTMDMDVVASNQRKAKGQDALMAAVKARIRKHRATA